MAEHQPASTWYTRRPPKELEDRDRDPFSLQVLSVHADLDTAKTRYNDPRFGDILDSTIQP